MVSSFRDHIKDKVIKISCGGLVFDSRVEEMWPLVRGISGIIKLPRPVADQLIVGVDDSIPTLCLAKCAPIYLIIQHVRCGKFIYYSDGHILL